MLSLHTNSALSASRRALDSSQKTLSTAQTRLSTGYRVSTASDDAAGLQIANRLNAQASGSAVAARNAQNSISMLQTADSALQEIGELQQHMKDLAIQAADASTSDEDRAALGNEFVELYNQTIDTLVNSSYGGRKLMMTPENPDPTTSWANGVLFQQLSFQVGAAAGDKVGVNLFDSMVGLVGSVGSTVDYTWETILTTDPARILAPLDKAMAATASVRSSIGGVVNQLQHAQANDITMQTVSSEAKGRIVDTDFAAESATMTSAQMLQQASAAMLKQSNSLAQLVISLVQ